MWYGLASLVKQAVQPFAERAGTTLAAVLIAYGVGAEQADMFVAALGAVGGIAFDVTVALIVKRKAL